MEEVKYMTADEAREISNRERKKQEQKELDSVFGRINSACLMGYYEINIQLQYQSTINVLKENGFKVDNSYGEVSWYGKSDM